MSLQQPVLAFQFPTLDYPELTDHSIFDELFVAGLKAGIATERDKFLQSWDESVELERQFLVKSKSSHTRSATTDLGTQFQALRCESYRKTRNSLFSYVYALYETELANPSIKNVPLTPERVAASTKALHDYIAGLNGDSTLLDTLIQELGTLQSKNQEFIFKVFVTLHGELLTKQLKQSQRIVDLQTELEKTKVKVDERATYELLQVEQALSAQVSKELQTALDDNQLLRLETANLKRRLEQSDAGNQTLIEDGEKETEELRATIKTLEDKLANSTDRLNTLESTLTASTADLKDSEARANQLQTEKQSLADKLVAAKELIDTLRDEAQQLSSLQTEASFTELSLQRANTRANELENTRDEIESEYDKLSANHEILCRQWEEVRKELDAVSFAKTVLENKNRELTEKINELQIEEDTDKPEFFDTRDFEPASVGKELPSARSETVKALEAKVENLNSQLRDAKAHSSQTDWLLAGLEIQLKTAKQNEDKAQQSLEQERSKSKELIGEIRSNNKITEELRELTRFCEQNHTDYSSCEIRAQTYRLAELEKENNELRSKMPFDLSRFGAQAGNDDDNLTANVSLKELETSLVKGLGELFTREDKKNIRVFRGKPSDPPITSWLKDAEVTAYLNGWDDEQKVRYFSDRLKDEAAEWLREYLENEGDVEYSVWKDALISRFRNQADVEHLKHCLQNLKQGTEQRTQSFIARINSLFDDIYGPVKKSKGNTSSTSCGDANNDQTDALLKDVKRMRDDAKRKILIRGLLPKIRTELWPRITEGASFEDICTAALTAESIVIQKELNEEKTIVVASVDNAQLKEKETELTHKQTLIDMLKEQNDMLKLIHGKTDSQEQPTQASTVGAVVNQTQHSGFIKSGNKNVQFKDTPHKQGTGNPNTNSRNPNAERHPKASQKQNQQTGQQIPVHPFGPYLNPYPAYWVPQQTNHSQHGYGYPFAPNQAAHPAPIYPTQIPHQFQGLQQLPGPPQPFHGPRQLALPPTHWGPPPPPTPNWGQPHANWNSQPPGSQTVQGDQQGASNRPSRRDVICHICSKKGHYARECWDNPANQQQKQ